MGSKSERAALLSAGSEFPGDRISCPAVGHTLHVREVESSPQARSIAESQKYADTDGNLQSL